MTGGLRPPKAATDGPPSAVTGHTAQFAQPIAALLRRAVLAGSLIGGVGLAAADVAGAISWALAGLAGGRFVTARSRPAATPRRTAPAGWPVIRAPATASPP